MKFVIRNGVVAAALICSTISLTAQAPALAGTWVVDREKTAALAPAPGGGSAGGGGGNSARMSGGGGGGLVATGGGATAPPEWTVTQTAAALTITRGMPDGSQQKLVYKLDGSESVNVNGRTTQKTKSTVAGGKITTVGTQTVSTDQGDVTSDLKEVRWLDKDGTMMVETTRTVNGSARTTTTAYKKK